VVIFTYSYNKAFIDIQTPPRYRNAASHSSPYGPLQPNVRHP